MNLHIVPDNVFINKFYENLLELGIAGQNKLVVRTNRNKLKYIRQELPFAQLYTRDFDRLIGDTESYEKVFVHQFTPLLYRWVSSHNFRTLNWMVWGSDLYNLPFLKPALYEPLTKTRYINRRITFQHQLYNAKVFLLHNFYRKKAYSKVNNILTWMRSEYAFASKSIAGLNADHRFFFYENETPYKALDEVIKLGRTSNQARPVYILGNSSTPELNHLDAVRSLTDQGVEADLWIPLSYGDDHYRRFVKRSISTYKGGEVRFIEHYLDFQRYLQLLWEADGLIMNNIRPQGYGNIFMMMYLGKKVFLNRKNFSIPELQSAGLAWSPIDSFGNNQHVHWSENRSAVTRLLSHEKLLDVYSHLF